ncbi:hypothetical protein DL237_10810 [Pseudooceanicola sediminis]|uniref:Uncharacterized protein n=1 Tax=Pseudooceanicola sediminis TaxID=2211117 RepID=A0A399J049_9RHOB|nr:hypothetical protein [Pseudooceanicola sediminis]KAA2313921.1 hypothetical protein E0K93_12505 [Puniceibacterium sp. HSS470]RII38735.1 hypothetical protein DL237_10810 [Pseudooceanicola sediminis]|tara:strand:+ start:46990 stop:47505 length:516 start_codon:yes stop_codon:yes gene_type:complete
MVEKLPTKEICDILGIDRQRLNEDIASGAYYFAPEAEAQHIGRLWDEADVFGLFVYSFLSRVYSSLDDQSKRSDHRKPAISKRVAAMYAEQIVAAARSPETNGASRIDFPLTGFNNDWTANKVGSAPCFIANGAISNVATICFSLDGIRDEIEGRKKFMAERAANNTNAID